MSSFVRSAALFIRDRKIRLILTLPPNLLCSASSQHLFLILCDVLICGCFGEINDDDDDDQRFHDDALYKSTFYLLTYLLLSHFLDHRHFLNSLIVHFVLNLPISGTTFLLPFVNLVLLSLLHIHLISLDQFMFVIITSTVHNSSFSLQAQNLPFLQVLPIIQTTGTYPLDCLHRLLTLFRISYARQFVLFSLVIIFYSF